MLIGTSKFLDKPELDFYILYCPECGNQFHMLQEIVDKRIAERKEITCRKGHKIKIRS